MPSLLDITPDALTAKLVEWGEPNFRGKQILEWAFRKRCLDPDVMTNLPRGLRERLRESFPPPVTKIKDRLDDASSRTRKLLVELEDGKTVECVVLDNRERQPTLCISSQVGCPMGCLFCATGLMGAIRNLTAGEILYQVMIGLEELASDGESGADGGHPNIVFMGMGEPLLNTREVLAAIRALIDPARFAFGQRRITLSTVGVTRGIRQFAQMDTRVNLAFSLHHADPTVRKRLIPKIFSPLEELMEALADYAERTRRLVTFEYVMLDGVNDGQEDARALVKLLKNFGHPSLVNLIPFNPVEGLDYRSSSPVRIDLFMEILEKARVRVTRRRTQGTAIDAACGQLALTGYPRRGEAI